MARAASGTTVEVRVELKPGVMDAEADNIEKSLKLLGVPEVGTVRVARLYSLTFEGLDERQATERAKRAVDQLLANPVIHRVEMRTRSG